MKASFVKNVKISKQYREELRKQTIAKWKSRMEELQKDSSSIDNKLQDLQFTVDGLTEKIKVVSVESVIKSIEADIIKLNSEIKILEKQKDNKDSEYINMEVVMDNIDYFLEHIEDLLLGSPDPLKRAAYFGILFTKAPTYNDLIFKRINSFRSLNVDDEGFEPPTSQV